MRRWLSSGGLQKQSLATKRLKKLKKYGLRIVRYLSLLSPPEAGKPFEANLCLCGIEGAAFVRLVPLCGHFPFETLRRETVGAANSCRFAPIRG